MKPNNQLIFRILKCKCSEIGLTANRRTVLIQLLDHWNPEKNGPTVWPGQPLLAERTGLHQSTVRRCLSGLQELGLIKIEGRKQNESNRYHIQTDIIKSLTSPTREVPSDPTREVGYPTTQEKDPTTVVVECLREPLTKALSHSDRQRKMALVGDVLSNALTGEPEEKAGNQSRADWLREQAG